MQGLYTADYFIEDGASYFERRARIDVRHADRLGHARLRLLLRGPAPQRRATSLRRTFQEAYRVLKPGGQAARRQRDAEDGHTTQSASTPRASSSSRATNTLTGLRSTAGRRSAPASLTRLLEPSYHWFFRDPPRCPAAAAAHRRARGRVRATLATARPPGLLAWLNHVAGGASFDDDRHQAATPGRRSWPSSEVFGDVRRGPVEHDETEHEHRRARSRSGPPGPPTAESARARWAPPD